MKHIYLAFGLLLNTLAFGQTQRPEIHCKHFLHGYPYGTPSTNDLIIRDIYALSNNDDTKFADWVAYRITMREVDAANTVERKWKPDPWLAAEETLDSSPDDYKGANAGIKVDRGHQAPLASFKGSVDAFQTNFYSNITPQKSDLNQGAWVRLENKVRDLVRTGETVFVMTGPLYEREMDPLPQTSVHHKVPSGYWKIISIVEGNDLKSAAFIFDQDTPRRDAVLKHQVTIDEIEQKSGLDFFWELEDNNENSLESKKNTSFAKKYFKD